MFVVFILQVSACRNNTNWHLLRIFLDLILPAEVGVLCLQVSLVVWFIFQSVEQIHGILHLVTFDVQEPHRFLNQLVIDLLFDFLLPPTDPSAVVLFLVVEKGVKILVRQSSFLHVSQIPVSGRIYFILQLQIRLAHYVKHLLLLFSC